jgi:hypothetical protein
MPGNFFRSSNTLGAWRRHSACQPLSMFRIYSTTTGYENWKGLGLRESTVFRFRGGGTLSQVVPSLSRPMVAGRRSKQCRCVFVCQSEKHCRPYYLAEVVRNECDIRTHQSATSLKRNAMTATRSATCSHGRQNVEIPRLSLRWHRLHNSCHRMPSRV